MGVMLAPQGGGVSRKVWQSHVGQSWAPANITLVCCTAPSG